MTLRALFAAAAAALAGPALAADASFGNWTVKADAAGAEARLPSDGGALLIVGCDSGGKLYSGIAYRKPVSVDAWVGVRWRAGALDTHAERWGVSNRGDVVSGDGIRPAADFLATLTHADRLLIETPGRRDAFDLAGVADVARVVRACGAPAAAARS